MAPVRPTLQAIWILALAPAVASAAETDSLSVATIALGRDASGERPGALAHARLKERARAQSKLRPIDPNRALGGATESKASQALQRGRAALADGRSAYDALALDDAIARIHQAIVLFEDAGPFLGDLLDLRTALAYLGAALVLRGSPDEAESTFLELLTLDPAYELLGFPEPVERVFAQAAVRLDHVSLGSIEVYSNPPYAAVYLDGRFEGVTPLTLNDLVAGQHFIRLEKAGYQPAGEPVRVEADESVTTQSRLQSTPARTRYLEVARRAVNEAGEVEGKVEGSIALAQWLGADVLVAVGVTQSGRNVIFEGHTVDARTGHRRATERAVLASNDPRFLSDLDNFLDRLVEAGAELEGPPATRSADPGGEPAPFGLSDPPGPSAPHSEVPSTVETRRETGPSTPAEVYLGWTLVGIGGAAVITGTVFGILALDSHGDFQDTSQTSSELSEVQSRGETYSVAADALLIGGGVALAGGIVLVLINDVFAGPDRRLSSSGLRPGVRSQPGGAVVELGGRF